METTYCPRCEKNLTVQPYARINMATCMECGGNWYSGKTLAKFLSLKKNRDLLDFSKDLFLQKESALKCPQCEELMVAKTFKRENGLTIDQCSSCQGVWLDKDELPKTKQFVKEYVVQTRKKAKKNQIEKLGKLTPLRMYPVPKSKEYPLPRVLRKLPRVNLDMDIEMERDEAAEEQELEYGTAKAEVTLGLWAFTALTGMPVEAYNPPRQRFPKVVISLIIINLIIHFLLESISSIDLDKFYMTYGALPSAVFDGNFLALFTHAFLHSNMFHLLGNLYFLWVFGDNVEDKLGHFNFILFFFLCVFLAAICQLLVMKSMGVNIPLVGASGGVAGVMGAYLYLFPKAALYQNIIIYPIKMPVTIYITIWVVIQFIGHSSGKNNVAWWAHLGGLLVGFVFIWLWSQFRVKKYDQAWS